MSPAGKLRINPETALQRRLCRGRCIITDYSVHSPAPPPETVSGRGESTSRQTPKQTGEGKPSSQPLTDTHRAFPCVPVNGVQHRPPLPGRATQQATAPQVPASVSQAGGRRWAGRHRHKEQLSISKQAPRAPVVPGGQGPSSWSINSTQGFGGKSILFLLKYLSYGHVMNWNTIF